MRLLFACLIFSTSSLLAETEGFFIAVGGINGQKGGKSLEGQYGTILKTTDLVSWKEVFKGGPVKEGFSHSQNNLLRCLTYGAGKFVATGNPRCVFVSDDGDSWRVIETPHGSFSVAFGDGRFLAGTASHLMSSSDGETWQSTRMDDAIPVWGKEGAGHIRKIVFGNGVFVFSGEQRIGVTRDGKTLLSHKIITDESHRASVIAFGNGKFVWLNPETGHQISRNGIDWSPLVIAEADQENQKQLLWTGEKFLVAAKGVIYSSTDGETWETHGGRSASSMTTYGNGNLIQYYGWSQSLRLSKDEGESWEPMEKLDFKARRFYFFNGREIVGLGGG